MSDTQNLTAFRLPPERTQREAQSWLRPSLTTVIALGVLLFLYLGLRPLVLERLLPNQSPQPAPATAPATDTATQQEAIPPSQATVVSPTERVVVQAYGAGYAAQARRDARRYGELAADAVACGLRNADWKSRAANLTGTWLAGRYFADRPSQNRTSQLAPFVAGHFNDAAQARDQLPANDPARRCDYLATIPDFRGMDGQVR